MPIPRPEGCVSLPFDWLSLNLGSRAATQKGANHLDNQFFGGRMLLKDLSFRNHFDQLYGEDD